MHNPTTTTGYDTLATRMRNESTLRGWIMPAVGVKIDTGVMLCGIGSRCNGPRFDFAQGRSMPTSRGSPPIYDD